jgi:predicted metal-binding membrane protein
MTSTRAIASGTLGAAALCWLIALQQMSGMDMGTRTELGDLGLFVGTWTPMMAAMMLPGALPVIAARELAAPLFALSYVAVWTLFGLAVFAVYRPHSATVAGLLTVAAGLYELTPFKRACRRRCQSTVRSGLEFGAYCVGSSIGLMIVLVSLGAMSVTWMAVIAAVVLVQKLVPPQRVLDIAVSLGFVALGLVVLMSA